MVFTPVFMGAHWPVPKPMPTPILLSNHLLKLEIVHQLTDQLAGE